MVLKILVTGCAGFIGMHVAMRLVDRGDNVVGIDNLNDYYEVSLKEARLSQLVPRKGFSFVRADISDLTQLDTLFARDKPVRVVHLAAQAGVRYSLTNPAAYIRSNLVGFGNILECCRHHGVEHLVYASSSSVYGLNASLPFRATQTTDHPVSLYGASKKSNELMAHAYSHLFGVPATGLRFFTVYGPWGRPDMSPALFTKAILSGDVIDLFNHGNMERDFTYIDDIVEGVIRILDRAAVPDPGFDRASPTPETSCAPHRLYNMGNHTAVPLLAYIAILERIIGRKANTRLMPMDPSDVRATFADVSRLQRDIGFAPSTPLERGLERYVSWYRGYYRV